MSKELENELAPESESALQKEAKTLTDADRRAALAKVALLTPPAMMTRILSARAQVPSPPSPPG